MAIVPMRQITVCGLKRERAQVLALLQRYGTVEPCPLESGAQAFAPLDARGRAFFEKSGKEAADALTVLAAYGDKPPALGALEGRKTLTQKQYEEKLRKNADTVAAVRRVQEQSRTAAEKRGENIRLENQLAALDPWLSLPVPTAFAGTRSTAAFIGLMPPATTAETLSALLGEKLGAGAGFAADIVFAAPDAAGVFVLVSRQYAAATEEALRGAGFMRPANPSPQVPADEKRQLELQLALNQKQIDQCGEALQEAVAAADDIRFYADYCAMRSEEYRVLEDLVQSRYAFFLTGWLPADQADALKATLTERFTAAVTITEPPPDTQPPVLLHNNGFTTPVESVVEAYSMPGKGEVDPSFVLSLFYYLLFGLMLSDAGYGILMVLVCAICLLRFKNMEDGMKNSLKMFFFCGVSTTFWGFLQGSFFGDIVGVVASTFFGSTLTLGPVWFAPLDDPMRMLLFALLLGIIHLFCGLAMNMVQHFKNKEYLEALYDGVFWYMLVGGLIVLLTTSTLFEDMAKFRLTLSPEGMTVLKAVIFGGMAGIILTAGRDSQNWVLRILKGVYGLYNMTGYLSDILSYSRLLALGLATGVIGTVINKMAAMAAAPLGGFGILVFLLIFLLGHTVNLGINLLGAYVHTNRLQFVEFFGKFYNGGGKKFEPFAVHTKYYKLSKEDI